MRGIFSKLAAVLAIIGSSPGALLHAPAALVYTSAVLLCTPAALLYTPGAQADGIDLLEARLEQTEDGVVLNADFAVDFNPRLEEVIANGVPLYFVVEFGLTRPRWYWFDDKTASKRLQTRLSYHVLSRHYRLSTGLLQQTFGTLSEALAVLRRVRNWQVLDRGVPLADAEYQAEVRMRLDLSLLPKPFQVNALTNREWHLESDWKRFAWRPAIGPAAPGAVPPAAPPTAPPGATASPPAAAPPADKREEGSPR